MFLAKEQYEHWHGLPSTFNATKTTLHNNGYIFFTHTSNFVRGCNIFIGVLLLLIKAERHHNAPPDIFRNLVLNDRSQIHMYSIFILWRVEQCDQCESEPRCYAWLKAILLHYSMLQYKASLFSFLNNFKYNRLIAH